VYKGKKENEILYSVQKEKRREKGRGGEREKKGERERERENILFLDDDGNERVIKRP